MMMLLCERRCLFRRSKNRNSRAARRLFSASTPAHQPSAAAVTPPLAGNIRVAPAGGGGGGQIGRRGASNGRSIFKTYASVDDTACGATPSAPPMDALTAARGVSKPMGGG